MIEVDAGQFAQYIRLFAARANTTPIIRDKWNSWRTASAYSEAPPRIAGCGPTRCRTPRRINKGDGPKGYSAKG